VIPNYGRTLSGVRLTPQNAPTQNTSSGPKLSYNFYAFTARNGARLSVYLPPSQNFDSQRPLRYAFSIDNGAPQTVQPVPNHQLGTDPSGWTESVQNNARVVNSNINVSAGAHTLHIWA